MRTPRRRPLASKFQYGTAARSSAYAEGQAARHAGRPMSDCPYMRGSSDNQRHRNGRDMIRKSWVRGWQEN